jgi:ribosome modulation factor
MQIEKDNPLENLQNTGQKTAINNRTEEKCPKVPNYLGGVHQEANK